MPTTNFNIRLDQELRNKAFPVFERYGLTATQAFKLFLTQVAETNKIPLSFDYANHSPNQATQDAIRQGREDYQAGRLAAYRSDQMGQALAEDVHA